MWGCESLGGKFNKQTFDCIIKGERAHFLAHNIIDNIDIDRGLNELQHRLRDEMEQAIITNDEIGYEEAGHRIAMIDEDKKLISSIKRWLEKERETIKNWEQL